MADKSQTEEPTISENICPVCKQAYSPEKYPKLLPCLHTVCEPCVSDLSGKEGEKPKCPDCCSMFDNNEVIKHLYKMEVLSQSTQAESQTSNEEKSHKCTACEEEEEATSFCTECMEWLCEQCVQAHRRVRVTKDHLIQAKEKVQEQTNGSAGVSVKERLVSCSLHPHEPLKLYCETCDRLTCRDCQLLEHKEHKYQFVHEASELFKRQLLQLVERLKEKRKWIENAKELNTKRQEEILSKEKAVAEEIKKTVENVIEEFNKRAKSILTDLKQVCNAKKVQLVQKYSEVNELGSQLDHCMNFVQALVENGSNLSILHTKPMIIKRMKVVSQTRCEVPNPNHVVDISYSHDSNIFLKNLNHLGLLFIDGVPFRPGGNPAQATTSQSDMNGSQSGMRNYTIRELQKLPSEQRNAVFLRMMQMQKRQAVQQNPSVSHPSHHPQLPGAQPAPNRAVSNNYLVNCLQNRSYNNSSYPTRFPSAMQEMNNGPTHQSPPAYSAPPGSAGYGPNNQTSNQPPLISLFQLQNQRGQSQNPAQMSQARPMPPLTLRPTNNGMPLSSQMSSTPPHRGQAQNHSVRPQPPQQSQQKNWRWKYLHMPHMTSPPRMSSGPPGLEQRPGSTNSVPDTCRSSPSDNNQRPASADSVQIKQEKDANVDGYSGYASCSYADKQNSMENSNHNKGDSQRHVPYKGTNNNHSGLLTESLSDDNVMAALQSLSEDGLPLGMDGQIDGSSHSPRHLAAPNKHMDSPDPSEDYCACCHNGGELLCCDYCPKVFHFQCHIPAVTVAPSGSWQCTLSLPVEEIRIGKDESREIVYAGHKRKSPVGLTDKELKACERILLELFSHEASTPFHEPVSKSVPNYYKIIITPQDFTNIKCKLSRQHFNHYSTVREFLTDVKLVFTNCAMYNSELSEVGRAGKAVYKFFELLVEKFIPYYTPFLKEDQPRVPSPPVHPSTPPPASLTAAQTAQAESEQAKGAKRRKMDKQNLIHYH